MKTGVTLYLLEHQVDCYIQIEGIMILITGT